ncbi:MAG: precorrin-2 C(20)-methyltransferase [Cohaesibacter sp.]|nr:precorrin-2 C(20)-methyltransferase [Cohaesibacter sp.]
MSGTLYGVGVGPGAPDLITLKAAKLIAKAKVIAYPAPDSGVSFARSIVAEHISETATEIPMIVPMRVERFPAQTVYDRESEVIAKHLAAGVDVVVLCEGDPFFFGSFMYVYNRLADRFSCEIVPGVSSLTACASRLKHPLAARNDVLSVIPGPASDKEFRARLSLGGSFAIIKVGRNFSRIRALLEEHNLLEKAGYVERATLAAEKVMPLAEVSDDCAPYFSMILIYDGEETWF